MLIEEKYDLYLKEEIAQNLLNEALLLDGYELQLEAKFEVQRQKKIEKQEVLQKKSNELKCIMSANG